MINKQLNGVQSDIKSESVINLFSTDEKQTQLLKRLHKQPWRTYYSLFVPKKKRKQQKYQANLLQKKYVARLWDIFLEKYFQGELEYFNLKAKKEFNDQKIIWQYWGQGVESSTIPEVVKLCFESVDKYKGDYQVIRLDENTINNYLNLPDFVWDRKKNTQFKHAFFADLIRLALLDIYGGIWIDATILLTAPIDEYILKQEFFMFQRSSKTQNKDFWESFNYDYFGWHDEHYVNVLNSFIVGEKNNKIIHTCLDIMLNFWRTQKDIPHYFIFQIMFNELMKLYFYNEENLIIDDTLVHELQVILPSEFNMENFNEILNKTHIHKMTYIKEYNYGSYYDYLLNLSK